VTSSSLEVFAALALTDSEFSELFCVVDDKAVPPFYDAYVRDVLVIIERNAQVI
jgi:glutamate dehydrogenase